MKRVLTIPLIFLVLFTGMSFNVATHYCSGMFVANKVSLSGKFASCGMEDHETGRQGNVIALHSCENFLSTYTLSGNYMPSSNQAFDAGKYIFNTMSFPLLSAQEIVLVPVLFSFCNRPPGIFNPDNVISEVICVFRI